MYSIDLFNNLSAIHQTTHGVLSPDQALPESVRPVAQNQQEVGFYQKIKRAYGLGNQPMKQHLSLVAYRH